MDENDAWWLVLVRNARRLFPGRSRSHDSPRPAGAVRVDRALCQRAKPRAPEDYKMNVDSMSAMMKWIESEAESSDLERLIEDRLRAQRCIAAGGPIACCAHRKPGTTLSDI